jgi:alanyl-tRNA synthetase
LNGFKNVFETESFQPILKKIEELSGKKYEGQGEQQGSKCNLEPTIRLSGKKYDDAPEGAVKSMRIIADHLRAATFIMGDDRGIAPSNVDQGYVARKLIRRAIRHGRMLGMQENFSHKIAEVFIRS